MAINTLNSQYLKKGYDDNRTYHTSNFFYSGPKHFTSVFSDIKNEVSLYLRPSYCIEGSQYAEQLLFDIISITKDKQYRNLETSFMNFGIIP